MLKYLLLCGLAVVTLSWLEPDLREMRRTASGVDWLPPADAAIWGHLDTIVLVVAIVAGLIFVVKLGLYMWREMSD